MNVVNTLPGRVRRFAGLACGLLLGLDAAAAMEELADCEQVPAEIIFQRRGDAAAAAAQVERYERYGPTKWVRADFKNPARSLLNGPAYARNCSPPLPVDLRTAPPGSWQRISFRFKTVNFFASGLADHLAIALRATFDLAPGAQRAPLAGRGLAIFPTATYAETFPGALGAGTTLAIQDDAWYAVDIVATRAATSAVLTAPGGVVARITWQDAAPADGTGYGFGVLCAYSENGSCEYAPGVTFGRVPFEVRFSDISLSWFVPGQESDPPRNEKRGPRLPLPGAAVQ